MRSLICAVAVGVGLALTNVSGVFAGSIQFTDPLNGSTLDPWWNANQQTSGYITYPSTYLGVPCVQFTHYDEAASGAVALVHDFSGPTYGDVSVQFYDTGAGQTYGGYIELILQNSALNESADLATTDMDWSGWPGSNQYNFGLFDGSTATSAVSRTQDWHQYEIDDTPSSLTISVDGIAVYTGAGGIPFDSIQIHLGNFQYRPGFTTYFTDFSFSGQTAPEPSTIALLGVGAARPRRLAVAAEAAGGVAEPVVPVAAQ